ncbi:MAG: hypothetical protein ACI8XO_001959 [Verrucomicrobiales bacterium]|jgi:hypothetical protein
MNMKLTVSALMSLLLLSSAVTAKDRDPIKVRDVTFKRSSSGWITADVEFQAGDFAANPEARKKDYLNRIKLTLTVAYEDRDLANSKVANAAQKKAPFEFYQRAVELTAVKRSKSITVRFFIPPAVVESKGFPAKPIAWMLDWEVEGVQMPVDVERFPKNFSSNLKDLKVFTSFNNFLAEGVKANEGIMLAQYHGPDDLQPRRDLKDFAFIRKEE